VPSLRRGVYRKEVVRVKVAWISANQFGLELLRKAITLACIDRIITLNLTSPIQMYDGVAVSEWYKFGIRVIEVSRLNESLEALEGVDLAIVAGWREKLALNGRVFVGFHPTLLPKGRGSAPIINTLLNDDHASGVTMFYLSNELDAGDIIDQLPFVVNSSDHARDVYNKVVETGKALLERNFNSLIKGSSSRTKQEGEITYNKKLSLDDNKIDLTASLESIYNKIRALSRPYKGAYIERDGKKLIIWEAQLGV
jgi:methionyl-tRNA formyltransferase